MYLALSPLFPTVIIDIIMEYSREKNISDYDYGSGRSASQLFYHYAEGNHSTTNSHHFWTYDIWIKPLHPKIKAIEIVVEYDGSKPIPKDISLADKSCFGLYRYPISKGWGIAFHPHYRAFSIKTLKEMDTWEGQRWQAFQKKLITSAYLDLWLQTRLMEN